mmetsp:Transcript_152866/g.271172  ORF Transcript_152866/g.271172 Transcript_152866/m.271172 type:complete len:282 (+) Transcript_152866:448-1293(+)
MRVPWSTLHRACCEGPCPIWGALAFLNYLQDQVKVNAIAFTHIIGISPQFVRTFCFRRPVTTKSFIDVLEIHHLDRVTKGFADDHRWSHYLHLFHAVPHNLLLCLEVLQEALGVHGRTHQDHPKVGSSRLHLLQEGEHEIRLDATLVDLIHQEMGDSFRREHPLAALVSQAAKNNPRGAKQELTPWAGHSGAANLVAHHPLANFLSQLRSDTLCNGDGSNAPGLCHHNANCSPILLFESACHLKDVLWHLCGLPTACLALNEYHLMIPDHLADLILELRYW